MHTINVLFPKIVLIVGVLHSCESMRLPMEDTASTPEAVTPVNSEKTYVKASTVLQSQPVDFIVMAKMVCAMNV